MAKSYRGSANYASPCIFQFNLNTIQYIKKHFQCTPYNKNNGALHSPYLYLQGGQHAVER